MAPQPERASVELTNTTIIILFNLIPLFINIVTVVTAHFEQ